MGAFQPWPPPATPMAMTCASAAKPNPDASAAFLVTRNGWHLDQPNATTALLRPCGQAIRQQPPTSRRSMALPRRLEVNDREWWLSVGFVPAAGRHPKAISFRKPI